LRPKLAGPSSGRTAVKRRRRRRTLSYTVVPHSVAQCQSVMYQFPRCDNGAEILATARYSRLICSIWSDEWIRILRNDYFLATVISYTDYFEVIVTLYPITEYPPTTRSHATNARKLSLKIGKNNNRSASHDVCQKHSIRASTALCHGFNLPICLS